MFGIQVLALLKISENAPYKKSNKMYNVNVMPRRSENRGSLWFVRSFMLDLIGNNVT